MSFYGNIKTGIRSPFVFDAVYSSRYEMEQKMHEDNIYNGRYVLVDYGEKTPGRFINGYVQVYIDHFDTEKIYYIKADNNNTYTQVAEGAAFDPAETYYIKTDVDIETLDETQGYGKNRKIDAEMYHANYDATVWQKVWRSVDYPPSGDVLTNKYVPNGEDGATVWEKYIMVAELNAQAPRLVLVTDAPDEEAQPHFDMQHSSTLDYRLHMPKNWNWSVEDWKGDPEAEDKIDKDVEAYNAGTKPTFNRFDYNAEGFEPNERHESDKENRTYIFERISGASYPTHDTQDKTSQICKYNETTGAHEFQTDQKQPDTKVLGIDLPAIGNVISQIWDLIYSGKDSGDEGKRKLLLKMERDLQDGEADQRIIYDGNLNTATVLGFLNYMLDNIGLPEDNVYQGELKGVPEGQTPNFKTWFGFYNAFNEMFGDRFDTVEAPDSDKYIPIFDATLAAAQGNSYEEGYITEETFNLYLESGRPIYYHNGSSYEPIKYKTKVQNGEEVIIEPKEPNHPYNANTKYYTVALSFWAYLNDLLKTLREAKQADWEQDFLSSKNAILNRPDLVYNKETAIIEDEHQRKYYSGVLRSDGTTSVKKLVSPQQDEEAGWQDVNGAVYDEDQVRILGQLPEGIVKAFAEYRKLNGLPQNPTDEGYKEIPVQDAMTIEEVWASVWGEKDVTTEVITEDGGSSDINVGVISSSEITNLINTNFTFD